MKDEHFEIFYANVSGIYREIQRIRSAFSTGLGIKSVQLFWIFLLKEHPEGMIASELAAASETNRSLVSRELGELLDKKLVRYEKTAGAKPYARKLLLTAKGKALAKRIDVIAMNIQQEVSKDISVKDMNTFYSVLSRLNESFSELKEEDIDTNELTDNH